MIFNFIKFKKCKSFIKYCFKDIYICEMIKNKSDIHKIWDNDYLLMEQMSMGQVEALSGTDNNLFFKLDNE